MSYPGSGWSSAEGPGRKIWGGGSGPVACAQAIPRIVSSAWDSGEQFHVNALPPVNFSPTPPPPGSLPFVSVAFWACVNQSEPVAGAGSQSVTGSYTGTGNSRDGWLTDYPSLALIGFQSVAGGGTPGTFGAYFTNNTGSAARSWRAVAMSISTAAVAPVQSGENVTGSGNTVTLPGAPTAGHLLVLGMMSENGGGMAPPDPPTGWTKVVSGIFRDGVDTSYLELAVRCVAGGEGAVVAVGDSSFSHWQFVSEWALT